MLNQAHILSPFVPSNGNVVWRYPRWANVFESHWLHLCSCFWGQKGDRIFSTATLSTLLPEFQTSDRYAVSESSKAEIRQ